MTATLKVRNVEHFDRITVHRQLLKYPTSGTQYSMIGQECSVAVSSPQGTISISRPECSVFSFEEISEKETTTPVAEANVNGSKTVSFSNIKAGTYKVLAWKKNLMPFRPDGLAIAAIRDVKVADNQVKEENFIRPFDFGRSFQQLPSRYLLEGEMPRQSQGQTPNCGAFAISLAASYWDPEDYGPHLRNGNWVEAAMTGDGLPGTFQGQISGALQKLGFYAPTM
jgi:hypothetical protein